MLVSLTEAAAANDLADRLLRHYCGQGRVVGAERIGHRWALPAGPLTILPPARPRGRPRKGSGGDRACGIDLVTDCAVTQLEERAHLRAGRAVRRLRNGDVLGCRATLGRTGRWRHAWDIDGCVVSRRYAMVHARHG